MSQPPVVAPNESEVQPATPAPVPSARPADGEKPSTAPPDPREGSWSLGVGLFFFGMALGGTTGLSALAGISQTLLSALFTFVGGALLSYTGFRRHTHAPEPNPVLDTRKVGIGLGCFSIGIMLGVGLGILVRLKVSIEQPLVPAKEKEPVQATSKQGPFLKLPLAIHGGEVELWLRLGSEQSTGLAKEGESEKEKKKDKDGIPQEPTKQPQPSRLPFALQNGEIELCKEISAKLSGSGYGGNEGKISALGDLRKLYQIKCSN